MTEYIWTLSHKLTKRDTYHGVEGDSLQDGKGDDKDHEGNSDDNDVGDRRWWSETVMVMVM